MSTQSIPRVAALETPIASLGAHQVSRDLANVLDMYSKENLSSPFAKSGCLLPSLSWPCAKQHGAWRAHQPGDLSLHVCRPKSAPGAAALALKAVRPRTPWASVTSLGPGGAPLGGSEVTGAACEVRKFQRPTYQAQGKGSPIGPCRNLKNGEGYADLESLWVNESTNAMITCAKKAENSTVATVSGIFYL